MQTVVGTIDAAGAAAAAAPPAPAKPAPAAQPKVEAQKPAAAPPPPPTPVPAPKAAAPASAAPPPASAQEHHGDGGKIRTSPLVRRIARENQVDLTQVPGTGAGGRVSKRDILAAVEGGTATGAPSAAPPPPSGKAAPGTPSGLLESAVPRERMYFGHYEVQPMSIMRQRIAEHMVLSKRTSPHVYSVEEVNVTALVSLRAKLKDKFEQETGTKLTYMPFFIRAAVEALRAYPTANSSVDGTNIVLHKECNIGMAVALDWGLIVPVIKNAEEKNFLGLARSVNDLAERARNKKLKPDEVQESTFSITNPGVFGGLFGLPVINQPNVAILGLGAIEKRPVVIDDAIAIRSMVYLTLSYDHRAVDGAVAHQFMSHIKQTLQNWTEPIL